MCLAPITLARLSSGQAMPLPAGLLLEHTLLCLLLSSWAPELYSITSESSALTGPHTAITHTWNNNAVLLSLCVFSTDFIKGSLKTTPRTEEHSFLLFCSSYNIL